MTASIRYVLVVLMCAWTAGCGKGPVSPDASSRSALVVNPTDLRLTGVGQQGQIAITGEETTGQPIKESDLNLSLINGNVIYTVGTAVAIVGGIRIPVTAIGVASGA